MCFVIHFLYEYLHFSVKLKECLIVKAIQAGAGRQGGRSCLSPFGMRACAPFGREQFNSPVRCAFERGGLYF
jgi:hypothetical protein